MGKIFAALSKAGLNGQLEFGAVVDPDKTPVDGEQDTAYSTIICVDFDGTLVDHCYPKIGKPVPYAIDWLKKVHQFNAKIILYTMRSDDNKKGNFLSDAVHYLESKGVELFDVNNNPQQWQWTNSPKVHGDIYIDDSSFGCPLIKLPRFQRPCVDWKIVGPALEQLCMRRRQKIFGR